MKRGDLFRSAQTSSTVLPAAEAMAGGRAGFVSASMVRAFPLAGLTARSRRLRCNIDRSREPVQDGEVTFVAFSHASSRNKAPRTDNPLQPTGTDPTQMIMAFNSRWILTMAYCCLLWPALVEAIKSNHLQKRFPVSKNVVWTVRWCANPFAEGRLRLASTGGAGARWTFETVVVPLWASPVAVFYTNPQYALRGFLNFMDKRGVSWTDDVRLLRYDFDGDFATLTPNTPYVDYHAWRFYRLSRYIGPPTASYVVPSIFVRRHRRLSLNHERMDLIFDLPAERPEEHGPCHEAAVNVVDYNALWAARWAASTGRQLGVSCSASTAPNPALPPVPPLIPISLAGASNARSRMAVAGPSSGSVDPNTPRSGSAQDREAAHARHDAMIASNEVQPMHPQPGTSTAEEEAIMLCRLDANRS
ncbi:hypothetical protein L249_4106 [Ophiocordyceps polyrhachis-furcata BCC 54312]|uniref:Uncharacterized protein n=1 Tax=Ophiocordyceps polyrhachis-furcata BCC 54312 TaxID=1330021 RepID=A0A367L551_9HYPO|nr:hypothetical protein L249_4106 [Ophiocordyceps polyrhachis-furcata BCC 54312]